MSEQPTFTGNADQRALAEQIFKIMRTQGSLFATDAPIRQTLGNLADFFAAQRKADPSAVRQEIEKALRQNDAIFGREEREDDVIYVISRLGAYRPRTEDASHMFKRRLYEPDNPLPVDDISVVVTTTRPALTTVEPVFISDYWQQQAGVAPMPSEVEEVDGVELVTEPTEELVAAEATEDLVEAPAETPETAPTPASLNTLMALPNGVQIDLRRTADDLMGQYGPTLVAQFRAALESDPLRRLVTFGSDVYPEAAVANFGKNDLRRVRDYIVETGEPLLDTQIISDIFYHNPRQGDYEAFRFALNYRLNREKDFEFVGVANARLWSTKGLPTIGGKRIKASEMGQIASYLEEDFDDSLADESADTIRKNGAVHHILTFFEWEYGILPYTKALATLLPTPLLPDQRTAVLRFESPQHYTASLVELRYPTGNRGGWLQGLEDFFHERLVPGAMITIARTEEPHIFTVTYEEQAEAVERLLVLDEKKNKFAFANVPYYSAVDSDMLINQQQYGRLRNLKSLPMNERRKSDQVLQHVFETVGEPVGTRAEPRYFSTLDDLYVALNVLRPASRSYLDHLLKDGEFFEADAGTPGAWYYTPEPEVSEVEEDDDYGDDDYDDEE
ncbi:MAG TPA: hypothetical protein VFX76_20920 [Roseiflexaceae bacterium]|nr:hypothetical protein [Roseiflexaceae bacterium]